MGDGIQKKYALILNGDTEARHLENVDRAIEALRAEDSAFEISVLSTANPKNIVANFEKPDETGLKKIASGLASQLDDDDLLVVYVTGHGGKGTKEEGCVEIKGQCLALPELKEELAKIQYGKRVVVMDQCYSGKGLPLFADKKTWVITQGTPNETVSCELFSPFFWDKAVPDADGDGVLTLQERYAYALTQGRTPSMTQFFSPGLSIALSGTEDTTPPFAPGKVEQAGNDSDLQAQLKRLKEGELALVMFSADWCEPCKEYEPKFEALAQKYGGRFLMIHAEEKGGEAPWLEKYGIRALPTVAFIDARGKMAVVEDPADPETSLVRASGYETDEQIKILTAKLKSSEIEEKLSALNGLAGMREAAAPAVPHIIALLEDPSLRVTLLAAHTLGEIGPKAQEALPALFEKAKTKFEFRDQTGGKPLEDEEIREIREIVTEVFCKAILNIALSQEHGAQVLQQYLKSAPPEVIKTILKLLPKPPGPSLAGPKKLSEKMDLDLQRIQEILKKKKALYLEAGGWIGNQGERLAGAPEISGEYRWSDHWGLGFGIDYWISGPKQGFESSVGLLYHFLNSREGDWDPYLVLPQIGFSYDLPNAEDSNGSGAMVLNPLGAGVRYFLTNKIYAEAGIRSRVFLSTRGEKAKLGIEAPFGVGMRF